MSNQNPKSNKPLKTRIREQEGRVRLVEAGRIPGTPLLERAALAGLYKEAGRNGDGSSKAPFGMQGQRPEVQVTTPDAMKPISFGFTVGSGSPAKNPIFPQGTPKGQKPVPSISTKGQSRPISIEDLKLPPGVTPGNFAKFMRDSDSVLKLEGGHLRGGVDYYEAHEALNKIASLNQVSVMDLFASFPSRFRSEFDRSDTLSREEDDRIQREMNAKNRAGFSKGYEMIGGGFGNVAKGVLAPVGSVAKWTLGTAFPTVRGVHKEDIQGYRPIAPSETGSPLLSFYNALLNMTEGVASPYLDRKNPTRQQQIDDDAEAGLNILLSLGGGKFIDSVVSKAAAPLSSFIRQHGTKALQTVIGRAVSTGGGSFAKDVAEAGLNQEEARALGQALRESMPSPSGTGSRQARGSGAQDAKWDGTTQVNSNLGSTKTGSGRYNILKGLNEERALGKGSALPDQALTDVLKDFFDKYLPRTKQESLNLGFDDRVFLRENGKPKEVLGKYDFVDRTATISRAYANSSASNLQKAGIYAHEVGHHLQQFMNADDARTVYELFLEAKKRASPKELAEYRFRDAGEWWAAEVVGFTNKDFFIPAFIARQPRAMRVLSKSVVAGAQGMEKLLNASIKNGRGEDARAIYDRLRSAQRQHEDSFGHGPMLSAFKDVGVQREIQNDRLALSQIVKRSGILIGQQQGVSKMRQSR